MSLINQMLQDLENRQAKKTDDKRSDYADGLTSVADYKTGKGFLNKRMMVYLVIFVLLLLALMVMRATKNVETETQSAVASIKSDAQEVAAKNPFASLAQGASKIEDKLPPAEAGEAKTAIKTLESKSTGTATAASASTATPSLASATTASSTSSAQVDAPSDAQQLAAAEDTGETDITLAQEIVETQGAAFAHQAELVKITISPVMRQQQQATFYFNSGFKYEFSTSDSGNEINFVFENTDVPNNILPKLEQNSYIKEVGMLKQSEQIKFILELADGVVVSGLEAEKSGFPQKLVLNLSGPEKLKQQGASTDSIAEKTEQQSGEMTRVAKPLTAQEQLRIDYETALNDLKQNNVAAAMAKMHVILEKDPAYLAARGDLMTLYFEKGDYQNVQSLLNKGLQQDPYYPPFVMMQARLFMLQKDNDQARLIMKSIRPDLDEYPDFYATLGSLEQQLGNYQMSAQIYLELIRVEPEQGRWWLGYGLALEALGKRNVALQAYEKSIATNSLPIDLEAYVKGRIDALGG